jgi:hypothetical protein
MLQKFKNHIWKGASKISAIVNVVILIVTSTFVANVYPLDFNPTFNLSIHLLKYNNWKVIGLLE